MNQETKYDQKNLTIRIQKQAQVKIEFNPSYPIKTLVFGIKKSIRKATHFFEYVNPLEFKIELIYSREEFDKKIGSKTEDWVTAHSFKDSFIIFHPNAFERYTSHNKNEFYEIITHETAHILIKHKNPNFSMWLNEGIAQFIAGQKQKTRIKPESKEYFMRNCLFKNSNYDKFIKNEGYKISYKIVDYFIHKYGKGKIIELLNIKYGFDRGTEKEFCRLFDLSKDEIIRIVRKALNN